MTASSRRTSSAESPRGGEGEVRGRSRRSQGLRSTISMRMRKRKKEETQAMRAPMVTGEGSLPESPMPWAQTKTSWAVTWLRGLAQPPEEVLEHAGVAFDGAVGAGAALLLDQEGVQGALPADEVLRRERRGRCLRHGGLRSVFAGDTMFALDGGNASDVPTLWCCARHASSHNSARGRAAIATEPGMDFADPFGGNPPDRDLIYGEAPSEPGVRPPVPHEFDEYVGLPGFFRLIAAASPIRGWPQGLHVGFCLSVSDESPGVHQAGLYHSAAWSRFCLGQNDAPLRCMRRPICHPSRTSSSGSRLSPRGGDGRVA